MTQRMSLAEYKAECAKSSVSPTGRVVQVAKPRPEFAAAFAKATSVLASPTSAKTAPVAKKPKQRSAGEETLAYHLGEASIPFEREYRFHPTRMWRFDFALPDHKIGVEVEGGTWTAGRHSRGAGFEEDCEKYNQAALHGWRVLTFTTSMVKRGEALKAIVEITR